MPPLGPLLRQWFQIDLRSLAVFRVGLALALLWDLSVRAFWIEAFLTDRGVMPVPLWQIYYRPDGAWSLHALSGEPALPVALLAIAAASSIALMLGWRTRAATVVCWLLSVSLHHRNDQILNSGDDLFRILLLFACFLPLGATWSLDARKHPPTDRAVLHPASAALLLQVVLVYWAVMAQRIGVDSWGARGDAVWLALHIDAYTTDLGIWVRDHWEPLLKPMTWAALVVEGIGPLFAFSPWRTGPLRTATVFGFIALHLSFGALMEVGLFWFVSCVSWTVFLPEWFWDTLAAKWSAITRLPPQIDERASWWQSSLALVALVMAVAWNVDSLDRVTGIDTPLPAPWARATVAVGMHKSWMVYSPPPRMDGWVVAVGVQPDGTRVGLRPAGPEPDFSRPVDIGDSYENQRWRRVLYTMPRPERSAMQRPYAHWLARNWLEQHPDQRLKDVELWFVHVRTGPTGERPAEPTLLSTIRIRLE